MEKQLSGIRGWLLLVAMGIIITPIRLLSVELPQFNELLNGETWALLTHPESNLYHPMWAPFLILEITFHFALLVASLYLIHLFFSKNHRFPAVFIILTLIPLGYMIFSYTAIAAIASAHSVLERNLIIDFIRALVGAAIWVPYMLLSKRVQATFIMGK